jgi:hypothetical protein
MKKTPTQPFFLLILPPLQHFTPFDNEEPVPAGIEI